jgi:hypothetical protein
LGKARIENGVILKHTNESQNENLTHLRKSTINGSHLNSTDNTVPILSNQSRSNNDDNTPTVQSTSIQKILSELKRRRNQSHPFQTDIELKINNQHGDEIHTNHRSDVSNFNNFITNSEVTLLPPKRKVDEHEDSFTKSLNSKDSNRSTLLEANQSSFIEG